jgi:hypothetical protein
MKAHIASRMRTKYEANINSWMITRILEGLLTQVYRKLGAKSHKILLFIDHFAAHSKNITFLSNIIVAFLAANFTSQLQPLDFFNYSHTLNFFFVIPFYLQSVLVHSENCVKDIYSGM